MNEDRLTFDAPAVYEFGDEREVVVTAWNAAGEPCAAIVQTDEGWATDGPYYLEYRKPFVGSLEDAKAHLQKVYEDCIGRLQVQRAAPLRPSWVGIGCDPRGTENAR